MRINILLILFLTFGSFVGFAKTYNMELVVNNENHTLDATEGACSYHWYRDGIEIVGENDHSLSVLESGNYSVVAENLAGEVFQEQATLLVTATGAIIKIYTIGDSTVQDYTAGYYPRKGWGQVLPAFFNTANVQIVNKAVGGTSSKSFYNLFWTPIKNSLVAGDFVFIQFGINDRATDTARKAPTGGVFESYLTKYITEARAKGAFPVLVSTARRNSWNADGVTVYDAYHDHPVAVRTVAASLKVPLIDLDAKAKVAMEAAGKTYCTRFWHNNYVAGEYANYPNGNTDDVHFQEMGAINNASMIIDGIKELSADANVSKLIPFIKPQYQIAVAVNPIGSDDATTRTASYPQGLTITLKTIPKTGKVFQKWNNASGTQISTATLTTVTSGTASTSYSAIYQGATTTCTATATAGGAISFCQGGSVILTASNGNSYVWKNGTTQVGTSNTYTATNSGSYTVDITNASGCKATSPAITVIVNSSIKWFADIDADGKGDPNTSVMACTQPTGYVADNTDLCPSDANKIAAGNCGCGKTETSCVDCNNVVNGTAVLDNCSRCVAGTTGKVACLAVGEAETDACSFDGIQETTNAGFKGTAYLNVNNVVGSSVVFMVNATNAGAATLSFRYANGGTADRPAQIILNGTTLVNNISFPATGAFTTYKAVDVSLTLLKGLNTLKLASTTAEGLANIDQIGYVNAGVSKGNCVVTAVFENAEEQDIAIYPNPTNGDFKVKAHSITDLEVIDSKGVSVFKINNVSDVTFGNNLPSGIYLLKCSGKNYKLIKE